MVDVAVEILSCSVPVPRDSVVFIVKTWWTQIEVEGKETHVKLPVLPMIEQFYQMKAKKTYVFVEVWYCNEELFPPGTRRFLGMAKSLVDNLLAHPQASPCMEWLDVYDPIEDITRGKMLLKVHAHFSSDKEPEPSVAMLPSPAISSNSNRLYSSYFAGETQNNKSTRINNRLPNPVVGVASSSVESSPFSTMKSIPVQTENDISDQEDLYNDDHPTPDIPKRNGGTGITPEVVISSGGSSNKDFQNCKSNSTPASTMSSSNSTSSTVPPRSKRIAAAIYNNYPDGLGH